MFGHGYFGRRYYAVYYFGPYDTTPPFTPSSDDDCNCGCPRAGSTGYHKPRRRGRYPFWKY